MSQPGTEEKSVGQVIMEGLTKAILQNTQAHQELTAEVKLLRDELSGLSEGLRELADVNYDIATHAVAALRVLDHMAQVSREGGKPGWRHIADILDEIRADMEREEQEDDGDGDGDEGDDAEDDRRGGRSSHTG